MPLINRVGGGSSELQSKTVKSTTSEQTITPDEGYDGISDITVSPIKLQSRTGTTAITPSTSEQNVTPSSLYDGLSKVTVKAIQTQTKSATPTTSSQDIVPDNGKYLSSVKVGAAPLQSKTVTPTTSAQTIEPDSGQYGLSQVSVGAIQTQKKSVWSKGNFTISIKPDTGVDGLSEVEIKPSYAGGGYMSAVSATEFRAHCALGTPRTFTMCVIETTSSGNLIFMHVRFTDGVPSSIIYETDGGSIVVGDLDENGEYHGYNNILYFTITYQDGIITIIGDNSRFDTSKSYFVISTNKEGA